MCCCSVRGPVTKIGGSWNEGCHGANPELVDRFNRACDRRKPGRAKIYVWNMHPSESIDEEREAWGGMRIWCYSFCCLARSTVLDASMNERVGAREKQKKNEARHRFYIFQADNLSISGRSRLEPHRLRWVCALSLSLPLSHSLSLSLPFSLSRLVERQNRAYGLTDPSHGRKIMSLFKGRKFSLARLENRFLYFVRVTWLRCIWCWTEYPNGPLNSNGRQSLTRKFIRHGKSTAILTVLHFRLPGVLSFAVC